MKPDFKAVMKIITNYIGPWHSDRLAFIISHGAVTWVVQFNNPFIVYNVYVSEALFMYNP